MLLAAETFGDGNWYTFPTIFPKDPSNPTNNPEDWINLSEEKDRKKAYEEAKKRDEVWSFGKDSNAALEFSEGNWKKNTNEDLTETVDEIEGTNLYTVNDTPVTRDDIINNLENEEFIESVRSGETNVTITDDLNLSEVFNKAVEFPSENKLNSTIDKISEETDEDTDKDTVASILGRSLMSGMSKLTADIYRTPEFIYDVAASGYNKLLDIQNSILPESMQASKIATTEELSELTGIDNKYSENLEAFALKNRELNEKYQKPIFENIKNGNLADAALSTAMSITESLPFMLSMMIPSMAGVKAGKMFLGTTAVMGSGRKTDLQDSELPELKKNANAILYGMAEATDVLMGAGTTGRAIRIVLEKEGVSKAKKFGTDVLDALIKDNPYLSPFFEGFQEVFTTYTQNATDIATGEDVNRDLTEGLADSFIVGTLMGTGSTGLIQGVKYVANRKNKRKRKKSIEALNNVTKNQLAYNEAVNVISILENDGDITIEEADELRSNLKIDVEVNRSIPENIEGDDRVEAIELQKKYNQVKQSQKDASDAFKPLYNQEIVELESKLQALALGTEAAKETKTKPKKPTQSQFDAALKVLEPLASVREELTVEQLEEVYEALGEESDSVIDISKKMNAVDLYNSLDNAKTEAAKETKAEIASEPTQQDGKVESKKADIEKRRQEESNSPLQSTASQKVGVKGNTVASQYEDEFVEVRAYEDANGTPTVTISNNQGDKDSTKLVIERKEFETLDEAKEYGNNYIKQRSNIYNNHIEKVNAKYDAELAALESKQQPTDSDGTRQDNKQEVEKLRQEEQAELLKAIPNAENYLTDGKVDREKITNPEDIAKFEEIYDKYDKVISPL